MSALLLDASVILAAFDADDELHDAASATLADPDATLASLDLALVGKGLARAPAPGAQPAALGGDA